jgi:uncharacterized protein
MNAPWFAEQGSIAAALGIGVAFGFALERAGLGSARKLVGQFHLTDFTVFKVMFTAIVTTMLGLFWLARFGVVDFERIHVPATFLGPQLIGGLVFGAGFAIAGLCPGTSCVAAASGRGDGVAVMAGMFAGALAAGFGLTSLPSLYTSGDRGVFTLPQVLPLPYGVIVAAVVAIALAGFAVAERIEKQA